MKELHIKMLVASAILGLAGCSAGTVAPLIAPLPPPPGRFEVVGRGPVTASPTSDLVVFQGVNGRDYAYTGTWGVCTGCFGDRIYAWDVTDPQMPVLTDSVKVDARVINNLKVNPEGTLAVITRENASSRRNGIVLLGLEDPAHPRVISEFWETLTGGVHNVWIDGNIVYAVNDGTSDLHVIDISNTADPRQIGRYGVPAHPEKYLHDVYVKDGLAYLSYWNDGLIIVDVGNGMKMGTPREPKFVSQYRYEYTVDGVSVGNTHTAIPYTNAAGKSYVVLADEVFGPDFDVKDPETLPSGYVHIVDVSDIEKPVEVAFYQVPDAGPHNIWIENDIMYIAYYNAGLRAVDVSGDMRGNIGAQGRELAVLSTTDANAFVPDRPLTWGAQLYKGLVYASDHTSGLWIARLIRGN